ERQRSSPSEIIKRTRNLLFSPREVSCRAIHLFMVAIRCPVTRDTRQSRQIEKTLSEKNPSHWLNEATGLADKIGRLHSKSKKGQEARTSSLIASLETHFESFCPKEPVMPALDACPEYLAHSSFAPTKRNSSIGGLYAIGLGLLLTALQVFVG